jgi:hypothetical protein
MLLKPFERCFPDKNVIISNALISAALCGLLLMTHMSASIANLLSNPATTEQRVNALLNQMPLSEKIGHMNQVDASGGEIPDQLRVAIESGRVG